MRLLVHRSVYVWRLIAATLLQSLHLDCSWWKSTTCRQIHAISCWFSAAIWFSAWLASAPYSQSSASLIWKKLRGKYATSSFFACADWIISVISCGILQLSWSSPYVFCIFVYLYLLLTTHSLILSTSARSITNIISDLIYAAVSGCMTAQVTPLEYFFLYCFVFFVYFQFVGLYHGKYRID